MKPETEVRNTKEPTDVEIADTLHYVCAFLNDPVALLERAAEVLRSGRATARWTSDAIREVELLPWVDRLMDGFAANVALDKVATRRFIRPSTNITKETAAHVVAKIDRKIARLKDLYVDGDLTREDYRDQIAKQRRQRDAYATLAASEPDPTELRTLSQRWRKGDARERWEVLNALFERIHIEDRRIIGYTPRMDRANRVALLVGTAFDVADDGPGAMGLTCGGGGI